MKKIRQGIFSKAQIGLDKVIPHAIGTLCMAGLVIFCWFARGPDHPVYGLIVVGWTLVLGPVVAGPVMRRVPHSWFRVPAGERELHRVLGVGIFRWLLERSGWERHVQSGSFMPHGPACSP